MSRARVVAGVVVAALVAGTAALVPLPAPAGADGTTSVAVTCTGLPIVGTLNSTVDVQATDSADPIAVGGTVTDTFTVPVPSADTLPISATITEVKLTIPVPAGVTVNGVTFTPSSFSGTAWAVSGSNLVLTLTGSVTVGGGAATPSVPAIAVATTVAGPDRFVTWTVPSSIVAKGNYFLGGITANCTPDAPSTVLITTQVGNPNVAPVATAQTVPATEDTATPVTLAGTDANNDALTFAVATPPAHGVVSGSGAARTYTPAKDFHGTDSFTFTANDGKATSAPATVTIEVAAVNDAPVASSPAVTTPGSTALPVTLSATDVDGDSLSYAVSSPPAHGALTGTAPALTYTPAPGYAGPDSIGFTASDGTAVANGTVSITVGQGAPAAPQITSVVRGDGEATVSWTAPTLDGGSPITGYAVTVTQGAVTLPAVAVAATPTRTTVEGLTNGSPAVFRVAAVNAKGTGPASAASTAVTPARCAPYPSCTAAVDGLYRDLLGRAPTAAERSTWLAKLNAGTTTVPSLTAALRSSTDHVSMVDPVTRLYRAYFLRIPDRSGLTFWIAKRRAGTSINSISDAFTKSAEFKSRYGALSNRSFVELVYQNVLGRPGEKAGVDYWTAQLDAGKKTRGAVMVGFSESKEYKASQAAEVHAAVLWIMLVKRSPTAAEYAAAVARLETPTPVSLLIRDLFRGTELASLVD